MTPPVFLVEPAGLAGAVAGATVRLEGPEGRHAVTVRRLSVGEAISLVDGQGRRIVGRVSAVIGKQALDVRVEVVEDEPAEPLRIVVVQALPKGDRGDLAVELLTEVGVDEIVPWAAENCITHWRGDRAAKSHQRWVDASRAAGKQSRRSRFPTMAPLATTDQVAQRVAAADLAGVLHEGAVQGIGDLAVPPHGEVVVVVGPEGGISAAELAAFAEAGGDPLRLGRSVLRTSSAGIAAVAALSARTARWNPSWEDDSHE